MEQLATLIDTQSDKLLLQATNGRNRLAPISSNCAYAHTHAKQIEPYANYQNGQYGTICLQFSFFDQINEVGHFLLFPLLFVVTVKSKVNKISRSYAVGCVHSVMSKRERENMNRVGKVLADDRR